MKAIILVKSLLFVEVNRRVVKVINGDIVIHNIIGIIMSTFQLVQKCATARPQRVRLRAVWLISTECTQGGGL